MHTTKMYRDASWCTLMRINDTATASFLHGNCSRTSSKDTAATRKYRTYAKYSDNDMSLSFLKKKRHVLHVDYNQKISGMNRIKEKSMESWIFCMYIVRKITWHWDRHINKCFDLLFSNFCKRKPMWSNVYYAAQTIRKINSKYLRSLHAI